MNMTRDHAGHSLAEALVALFVAGLFLICLTGILVAVGRVAARHADSAAAAETERTIMAILSAELRTLTAADAGFGPDSVRLRAFRGGGDVCAVGPASVDVRYRGVRLPEQDKDSVLLIWTRAEAVFDLVGTGAGSCAPGSLRLDLSTPLPDSIGGPLVALAFETGAYSIGGAAFRYRRGGGGRQPLSEDNLSSASGMRFVRGDGNAAVLVTLRSLESRRAPTVSWRVGLLQATPPAPAP